MDSYLTYKIRSLLRKIWFMQSGARKEALARVEKREPSYYKNGNRRMYKGKECFKRTYTCEVCSEGDLPLKEVEVDHIGGTLHTPGAKTAPKDWDWQDFISGLFCKADQLQILCKAKCHKEKTAKEATKRAKSNQKVKK